MDCKTVLGVPNHDQQRQHQQGAMASGDFPAQSGISGLPFSWPMALQQQPQLQQQHFSAVLPHNLIPLHLQGTSVYHQMNGSPGYPPAIIPPHHNHHHFQQEHHHHQPHSSLHLLSGMLLAHQSMPQFIPPAIAQQPQQLAFTVQDRPVVQPVYNGVNPDYPGLRVLHQNPPIFVVDNFLSPFECEFLMAAAQDSFGPAPVVGKGFGEVSPSRTSSTCYLAREDLPDIIRKVQALTGKPPDHCELPQVGRYFCSQQYLQHYDAFDLATDDGRRFAANGGQRTVTVLIYLNTVAQGGATRFPALDIQVQPICGMALVFFPATVDGYLDKNAMHAALPAVDVKYVSQIWIRQTTYSGQPSKRLPQTLGVPFGQETSGTMMIHQTGDSLGLGQIVPNPFAPLA